MYIQRVCGVLALFEKLLGVLIVVSKSYVQKSFWVAFF